MKTLDSPVGSDAVRGSAKPARVLFVEGNEDGTVGGSHQVLYDLVRHFDRTAVEPVLLFYEDNRFARMAEAAGVETICWDDVRAMEREAQDTRGGIGKLSALAQAIVRRRRFLQEKRIDLVHMNNSPRVGHDDWLPAARLLRVPIVSSARGDADPLPGDGIRISIHRRLMRMFDRVICVSEYIAEGWRNQGVPHNRIAVVHDGVDQARLALIGHKTREEIRQSLGVPEGRFFAAMVGNIREWKGQHVVLQALGLMSTEERDRIFVSFIGSSTPSDAAYVRRLESLIEDSDLSSSVGFAGRREDVPEIMANADVVVHASVTPEPAGMVIIEAMTFGAPVVVASKGGQFDYLEPGLARAHDVEHPEQLAAHLVELAGDEELRREMVVASKRRAAQFTSDTTSRKMEAVYSELV